MHITELKLRNFRCFETFGMQPAPGLNAITGDNATGKTSLLEAVHILGRGRSFRGSTAHQLERQGGDRLTVHSRMANARGLEQRIGVARERNNLRFKLDEQKNTTRFDLVTTLPLQLIDPNLHRLFEQGPRFRRNFLDWGVFHVEHSFFPAWRQYRRALQQRNRALRDRRSSAVVTAWDGDLVRSAQLIDHCRRRYVHHLLEGLPDNVARLVDAELPDIQYLSGWRGDCDFATALQHSLRRDQQAGFTQQGPHRADLRVQVAGVQARRHVSRGQQKILAAALLLTQAHILKAKNGIAPVVLIDDPAAELGQGYLSALFEEIDALGCQCFATFLDASAARACCPGAAMFHVEHRSS